VFVAGDIPVVPLLDELGYKEVLDSEVATAPKFVKFA
jgi:hypothetical protein